MIAARQFAPQTTEGITRRRRRSGAARMIFLISSILLRTSEHQVVVPPSGGSFWYSGMDLRQTLPLEGGTTNCAFSMFQGVAARHEGSCGKCRANWRFALPSGRAFHSFRAPGMKAPAEKSRANWPLCLVFPKGRPKGRIEGVKAKRPARHTLAPRPAWRLLR